MVGASAALIALVSLALPFAASAEFGDDIGVWDTGGGDYYDTSFGGGEYYDTSFGGGEYYDTSYDTSSYDTSTADYYDTSYDTYDTADTSSYSTPSSSSGYPSFSSPSQGSSYPTFPSYNQQYRNHIATTLPTYVQPQVTNACTNGSCNSTYTDNSVYATCTATNSCNPSASNTGSSPPRVPSTP